MSERELLIKIQTVLRTPSCQFQDAFGYRISWIDELLAEIEKHLKAKDV